MKAFWQGSDALFLVKYPPSRKIKYVYMFCLRLFARLVDFFVVEHVCDHALLRNHLIEFGMKKPISIRTDKVFYPVAFEKKKHDGFNVLYYFPAMGHNIPYSKWLYGYDIYERLRDELTDVNWIVVDGTSNMAEVFPLVDFYIRPNRHDGASRLRQECEINKIPYYWSQMEPSFDEIKEAIEHAKAKAMV